MSLAVTGSIAGPCRPGFRLKLAPCLHPMFNCFHPGNRAAPSAVAMRIKKVCVSFFQVFLAARASRRQRTFAFRTGEQQHVCKMLFNIWQACLGSEGLGGILRLLPTGRKHKSVTDLPYAPMALSANFG